MNKDMQLSHPLKEKALLISSELKKKLALSNVMQIPKLTKVVINIGLKDAVSNSKVVNIAEQVVGAITGQKPLRTFAKKSIAGFKIREGMPIGVCVTLRGIKMLAFLDKLINLSLPRVRDFQGVSTKFDGKGNYNLGIKEWTIFPEAEKAGAQDYPYCGLNITIGTTAVSDEHARALLQHWGMPFRKK
jgi:large subunit ribosomal protein L5